MGRLALTDRGRQTEQQLALLDLRRQLAESEQRLAVALRVTGLGSWEWEPDEDRLLTSEGFTSLLGLPPGTELKMADALAVMPPLDADRVRSALDEVREGGLDEFTIDYQVTSTTGDVRWQEARWEATRHEDGTLACLRGTTRDVTKRVLASDRLREAGEFWQATLDSLNAHIAVLDDHGTIVAVNQSWRRFAANEGSHTDYIGASYVAVCEAAADPLATEAALALKEILAGTRAEYVLEYPCHSPSTQRWFRMRATRYAGSDPLRVVISHDDITEAHGSREQLIVQARLLDEVDVSVIATDPERIVTSWNRGAEQLYGWTAAEAIGRPLAEVVLVMSEPGRGELLIEQLRAEGRWDGQVELRGKDGSGFPAYVRNTVMRDRHGAVTGLIGVSMDASERIESERALLSARNYVRAVTESMAEGVYAVDAEGRLTYMNQAAEDLVGWTAAELDGVIVHDVAHYLRPDGSDRPMDDCPIRAASQDGVTVRVEEDVFVRRDGTLIPVAYTAAPLSTEDGIEGCVVVFDDITAQKAERDRIKVDLEKLEWVRRVQEALAEKLFVLYAQPIVEIATGRVVQRELLLRMLDPTASETDATVISPGAFLPVAEEFGLISEIDRWVIAQAAELAATGGAVELNISGRSITDPGLIEHIRRCIEASGADPKAMVFEITETALIADQAAARTFADGLHGLGCTLALDDFGTGYGGFTYLKQLQIDFLKIDIEFVRDLSRNPASRSVVQAIVHLASGFNLSTVAEGVEDAQTLDLLRELGVDCAQGYHLGRPEPLETEPLLTNRVSVSLTPPARRRSDR
jgi:PAS domain S-box-containing protein